MSYAIIGFGKIGQDYHRLRIGVDPPGIVPQKDYVLGVFTAEQKPKVQAALDAGDTVQITITDDFSA